MSKEADLTRTANSRTASAEVVKRTASENKKGRKLQATDSIPNLALMFCEKLRDPHGLACSLVKQKTNQDSKPSRTESAEISNKTPDVKSDKKPLSAASPFGVKEAEAASGLDGKILRRACQRGKLRASKDKSGNWSILPEDLKSYVDKCAKSPQTPEDHNENGKGEVQNKAQPQETEPVAQPCQDITCANDAAVTSMTGQPEKAKVATKDPKRILKWAKETIRKLDESSLLNIHSWIGKRLAVKFGDQLASSNHLEASK